MNHIIYLVINNSETAIQCICSLKSLFQNTDSKMQGFFKVLIYTNIPSYFQEYENSPDVTVICLNEEKITQWKGKDNYIYRSKIMVLKHHFLHYTGTAILIDSDTFFVKSPIDLFEKINTDNSSLMYVMENLLGDKNQYFHEIKYNTKNMVSFHEYLEEHHKIIDPDTNQCYEMPDQHELWNSGVIGLKSENKDVLDDALNYSDCVYRQFKIRTAEQFAYSYALQNKTKIYACDDVLFHYYFYKDIVLLLQMRYQVIDSHFDERLNQMMKIYNIKGIDKKEIAYEDIPLFVLCLYRLSVTDLGYYKTIIEFPDESNIGMLLKSEEKYLASIKYLNNKYNINLVEKMENYDKCR